MNSRMNNRLNALEQESPKQDGDGLIIHSIVKPSPDGPIETGDYYGTRVGGSGLVRSRYSEGKTEFITRIEAAE
jgi:hypothetical protein